MCDLEFDFNKYIIVSVIIKLCNKMTRLVESSAGRERFIPSYKLRKKTPLYLMLLQQECYCLRI